MAKVKAEPNVVPLCDVLLVLLIIFMVITPLVQLGIDVKLPETTDIPGPPPPGVIVLTLHLNGSVDINKDNYADLRAAQEELRRVYSTRSDKTIFIRADERVPYNRVVELIDLVKGAGIEILGLIPERFSIE